MKLRVDLALTVPKDIECPQYNEDAWAVDDTVTKIALSDGASESFDSRTWAHAIVYAYSEDSSFSVSWLKNVLLNYLSAVDYESLSWSKQAAFDRGSFATLLGLELAPNGLEVEIIAIGDSVAFHVRNNQLLTSFPYVSAEQFNARPLLLSTVSSSNAFINEPRFLKRHTSSTWPVQGGDMILLATDAVAQWALNKDKAYKENVISYLLAVKSAEEFESKILELRREARIRVDDSTLIRLIVET